MTVAHFILKTFLIDKKKDQQDLKSAGLLI